MNEKFQKMITVATEAGSRNRLTLGQVQCWLSEYLQTYHEDTQRFPQLLGKAHADVLIADFDKTRLALFVAAVFTDQAATFTAGLAESSAIRAFADREFPEDANKLITDLENKFGVAEAKLVVSRQEIENWLTHKE